MKTFNRSAVISLVIAAMLVATVNALQAENAGKVDPVNLVYEPSLKPLAEQWYNQYKQLNPDAPINLSGQYQKMQSDKNIISLQVSPSADKPVSESFVVGKQIVIPLINRKNPVFDEIMQKGITLHTLAGMCSSGNHQNGANPDKLHPELRLNLYMADIENVRLCLEKLAGTNVNLQAVPADKLLVLIAGDPFAIGLTTFDQIAAITPWQSDFAILPIDKNGNGMLDRNENIYASREDFLRGVWIGKYPKSLVNNITVAYYGEKATEANSGFLTWLLGNGQIYLNQLGYGELTGTEKQAQFDKINVIPVLPAKRPLTMPYLLLMVLGGIILLGAILALIFGGRKTSTAVLVTREPLTGAFNENTLDVPNGVLFDKTHTWAFMERNGNVTIGIDDFLRHVTGEISRIEIAGEGSNVNKGDTLFRISQAGKWLSIAAPVSGRVKKLNAALLHDTSLLISSPYEKGWICAIEPYSWLKESGLMLIASKYRLWIKSEFIRLKDFLAALDRTHQPDYQPVIFQDGGMVSEGVLKDFGPQVWEDFQEKFLNLPR